MVSCSRAAITTSVFAWNVESGGSDPQAISERLTAYKHDIICLSEVHPDNHERYSKPTFWHMLSETGGDDRLMIQVSDRFEVIDHGELHQMNDGRHRSPIFVRVRDPKADLEFIVVTVHLARGNAEFRIQQAIKLREWACDQTAPILAIGDFNFDYDIPSQKGNEAFDEMVRNDVWKWLRPPSLIDTNWFDGDGDGKDDYPYSMLDMAFAANLPADWCTESKVLRWPRDFPDDESTSDHRPIQVVIGF